MTALADPAVDPDAARLLDLLAGQVEVVALPAGGSTPVKTRMLAGGRPLLRLDRGGLDAPAPAGPATDRAVDAVAGAGVLVVSDYGRGTAADPALRDALTAAARRVPLVWDPHPRGPAPVAGATAVTPNLAEARSAVAAGPGASGGTPGPDGPAADEPVARAAAAGAHLVARWDAGAVVVTVGEHGAVSCPAGAGGPDGPAAAVRAPAPEPVPSATGDACGAGDRFAAALGVALGDADDLTGAVTTAVAAAGAFVAGGGAGAVRREADGTWTVPGQDAPRGPETVDALLARVRARGGRVVATGGCFDLVHAGHARTLDAARDLAGPGGAVVVCLNSDASVRRLKGPERPLVDQHDRAELLGALRSVDAVVVFDEDDPRAVLDRLRPEVWVKGGDYAVDALAETPLVRSWGGDVVTVPFHAGRSTTALAARLAPALDPVLDPAGDLT